jgi:hypothetical protein
MPLGLFLFPKTFHRKEPMFIPFLAASVVAIAFAQLGAMTVKIAVLTMALQAMCALLVALAVAAPIGVFVHCRHKAA